VTRARAAKTTEPVVEELQFRSDNAFLCLLVNRRTKMIRVIDFRAGALPAKRLFIQSVAQREGVEKVILLVEKDEVSSWTRVGFVREGTVPGFYKRSDGHLVGCVISDKTASVEVSDATQRLVERTLNAARKGARSYDEADRAVSVKEVVEKTAMRARDQVWNKQPANAFGGFDTFGRNANRVYYEATPRRGKANYLSAEFQDCFGHSLVEVLRMPQADNDVLGLVGGLRRVCDDLKAREIVSAFSFAPAGNVPLSTAYVAAGFRKTGLLARGVLAGGERADAVLWSRKLVDPSGGGDDALGYSNGESNESSS
jgi:hypothetical protein